MPEKLSKEQVEKLFSSKGYILLEEYRNSNTPILCSKDEYRYKISYTNLKCGKNPSLWGFNNIINLEHNISILLKKKQSKSIFLGYEVIIKNKKKRILLHFKCACGNIFDKVLENAVYNTYICCQDCATKKRGKTKRVGAKAIEYIESQGYCVLNKNLLYKNNDLVEVENSQGYKGFVTYSGLRQGKGMSLFDIRINKKYYIYNVNIWAKNNGIEAICTGFSKKEFTRQGLEFKCSCGNKFETSISSFQNGKIRCDNCAKSISRYENEFKKFLEDKNIKFIYQYSLNQCRDILPLPFDFYIVKDNFLVEIDGEGHYSPCNFNQISNKKAQDTFMITKKHDEIKNNFCKDNNIPLLRIPYYAFKDESYKKYFLDFRRRLATSG